MRRSGLAEFIVKAAVTLGLLAFLLYKVDLKTTAMHVASAGLGSFAFAIFIILVLSALVSSRWKIILDIMQSPLSFLACWRLVVIGLFFNQTLPSSVGGDAVRIWLCSRLGKGVRTSAISVVLDRAFALISVGVCVWVALPLMLDGPAGTVAVLVSLLILLASAALFGFSAVVDRWSLPLHTAGGWLRTSIARVVSVLREMSFISLQLFRRPRAGATVLGISVVNQLALGFVVYIFVHALGAQISLGRTVLIFPLVMLLSMIPVSLGGWGVREASMVWVFGAVGVSAQDALAISILFGLANTAAGLPGGVLWLLDRRTKPAPDAGSEHPRIVGERELKISPWVTLVERKIQFVDDRSEVYHAVAQADYVAILAVTPDGRIPLVHQYRPALNRYTWELPAGMVDKGETAEQTCIRELSEETGLVAVRVHPLGTFAADSARLTNNVHSFLVETEAPRGNVAELEVSYVSFDELRERILSGDFDLQYHLGVLGLVSMRREWLGLLQPVHPNSRSLSSTRDAANSQDDPVVAPAS